MYSHGLKFREQLFQNIQRGVLKIPARMSEEAKQLIVGVRFCAQTIIATEPEPEQETWSWATRRRGD